MKIMIFNYLPHSKILERFKLKASANDNSNVHQMEVFICEREKNIAENGENVSFKHFLLFQPYIQELFQSESNIAQLWSFHR